MPRRTGNTENPLQLRIQVISVPKKMTPEQYLRSLLRSLETGTLPRGVNVELHWRNPATQYGRTKNWQSDEFLTAMSESSEGFTTAVHDMIVRKLNQIRGR